MEILMKLKCSPTTAGASHSTIKVVDHHHELQQQHILNPQMRVSQKLPPCVDCCSAGSTPTIRQHSATGEFIYESAPPPCCMTGSKYETPICCSTMGYGIPSLPAPLLPLPLAVQPPPTPFHSQLQTEDYNNASYEYQEPEENFVSIDDAKIEEFLKKIGQEQAQKKQRSDVAERNVPKVCLKNAMTPTYEIIDLDDVDEREKLKRLTLEIEERGAARPPPPRPTLQIASNTPKERLSPDISLIPKRAGREALPQSDPKHKIIAEIDLLDSTDSESHDEQDDDINEEDSEDEDLPLAAAAVSCELDCDNDGEDRQDNAGHQIVLLPSDEEENIDFINEHEEGPELRWDDLEDQRDRAFFECFLCCKKVQSSYNLRRHMMIHTGERPFGCDMCARRFREFSDLKKHRRRHVNESNFVCMVCRINPPIESDPTRCNFCDTKNGTIFTSLCPQLSTTPETSQTPPIKSMAKPPSRNITPASGITSSGNSNTPPPESGVASPQPTQPPLPAVSTASKKNSPSVNATPLPPLIPIGNNTTQERTLAHEHSAMRKEFPCPLCQRPFGTRHNLKRHFMIHTGEKPFNCPKCRKPFREYSTLKKHMVTHQRDRWYKCLRCPSKYRDYLDYMQHKNTHPKEETTTSNTGSARRKTKGRSDSDNCYDSHDEDSCEDWLECCECGQRYTNIDTYTEHLKEHDPSLQLYECYICRKTFDQCEALTRHVATHSDNCEKTTKRRRTFGREKC